ncbi:MAG: Htaa protein [Pseudonocardiales bacterium]|nr:Htaa protein [Pseudonocardiales bacterium]
MGYFSMQSTPVQPRRAERHSNRWRFTAGLGAAAITASVIMASVPSAQAATASVTGGNLDWGVKASFRSYITGPIATGSISVADGASTNADGTFRFPALSGSHDAAASTAAAFGGSVHFTGHAGALDITLSDIKISMTGAAGSLTADVVSKSLDAGATVVSYPDVAFATLTPSAPTTTSGTVTWTAVPTAITAAGVPAFANFYPAGTAFDPATIDLNVQTVVAPAVPTVVVSKLAVNPLGDTVTVTGSGFDPDAALGTRPPLSGVPAGAYVTFGSFANVWKPSAGAPSSARPTPPQADGGIKWAVLAADRATVGAGNSVTLNPDGSFVATLNVKKGYTGALDNGNYGIYTYAGSGSNAPSYETFTPLSFSLAEASETITTTVVATGGLTLSVAGPTVVLPSPDLTADGSALTTSGAINAVTVTDLRSANPGWNVNGQLSAFVGSPGTFPGTTLGWTPSLTSKAASQTVTTGGAIAANGGAGLTAGALLASAPAGAGRGTAVLGATINLVIPTETAPGTYSATLTLTAI